MAENKLTADGVALLREVQLIITAQPEHFDMDRGCGSACCIAGWLDTLKGGPARTLRLLPDWRDNAEQWKSIATRAAAALGFPYEMYQHCEMDTLFLVDEWPAGIRDRYEEAQYSDDFDRAVLVALACERIDQFIAEHAPEVTHAD